MNLNWIQVEYVEREEGRKGERMRSKQPNVNRHGGFVQYLFNTVLFSSKTGAHLYKELVNLGDNNFLH